MSAEGKRCAAVLALLSLGYFALFVPANSTGAADSNMIGAFELDEFGQYHAIWRMTEPSDEPGRALRQFVAYDFYTYGFPFFGGSAALLLPLRRAYTEAGAPGLVQASMLVLRQSSVVLDIASILLLVGIWTGWRRPGASAALFVFLAALPALVADSLWWHSDALVTFFGCATLFALVRDERRLGGWFYAAAVAAGLATATKLFGLWFFAAVALHLWRARGERPWREVVGHGAGFTATMALATVAASPMLFVPGEAARVGETLGEMSAFLSFGWGERGEPGLAAWAPKLTAGFGWAPTLVLFVVLGALTAWRDPDRRDAAATILAFAGPFSIYLLFFVAKQEERYLLPVLLPLASCVASPVLWRTLRDAATPVPWRVAAAAVALLLGAQWVAYVVRDVDRYTASLEREHTSPSLAFGRALTGEIFAGAPPDARLRVLRDPYVYLPPDPRFEMHIRWGSIEPADLRDVQPDLLLLRRHVLERGVRPGAASRSYDPARHARAEPLYRDALADAIPGYRLVRADDFALAFLRTPRQARVGR